MIEFPIPVRMVGAGSHIEEDELTYMAMPQGMDTFRAPILPEPEEIAAHGAAKAALQAVERALAEVLVDGERREVTLADLSQADRDLVNSVLGEGEVSACVQARSDDADDPDAITVQIQESVYAGIWRVLHLRGDNVVRDTVEIGEIPRVLDDAARADERTAMERWSGPLPPNVQNAPLLLGEIEDQFTLWQAGQPAYVINLTLLPMSNEDIGFMDHHLGTGRVLILSRGYGNCRITNCCVPNTWRVVYYNSQDTVILNTVEIGALPDVARAAREDLEDSQQRFREVLAWLEDGNE
ncbi:hydrogenase expression/formation protein [Diaphorobacter sp. HDW4A]|uniref:hydrogenase expression/formation protein n=1 Tax=Diaphorobacter sp. HDW4A TaxID=2714924 RepID=UPI00140ABE08|nr:hydrogenase expression/formation protein [Diaphorobacter sp. HDW4A]QIL79447.1 hydrogenase expression/formation protein [Diaphorobacter sp. HDW4A]